MFFGLVSFLVILPTSSAAVDFDTEVLPILTKAGCNSGACHGAAAGRGGFRLSLYGSRPEADFSEIALALEGRRINYATPAQSLVLQKPTEQLSHEGGTRLSLDGSPHQILRQWIEQGAKRRHRRTLDKFRFRSNRTVLRARDEFIQLSAEASFTDGTQRDVLDQTVITVSDPAAVTVDEHGIVQILLPGSHVLVARYLDRVVPLEVVMPYSEASQTITVSPSSGKIDRIIDGRLNDLGLQKAAPADDATLVRRLWLDLTGTLPPYNFVSDYVRSVDVDKKAKLVDELLKTDAYVNYQTYQLAQLLKLPELNRKPAAQAYFTWIKDCVANNTPLNQVAQQLIMAEGSLVSHPPSNFYATTIDPRTQAEFFSRVFLGVRLQCANCHDHPLDAWTQDDYHGLAAIFAKLRRETDSSTEEYVIRFRETGMVIHPTSGDAATPRIPGERFLQQNENNRAALAEWLTTDDNPLFAKAIVNRIWQQLMGQGLVEPVDDMRITNPASHPQLLNWLANDFQNHGYSVRHVQKLICLSDAYGRSSKPNSVQPMATKFYASAVVKPMSTAVYMDAVADVTGVAAISQQGQSERMVSLTGLTELQRPQNSSPSDTCTSGLLTSANDAGSDLAKYLSLINGSSVNERVAHEQGTLAQDLQHGLPATELVDKYYRRTYSRSPSTDEKHFWRQEFSEVASQSDLHFETAQDFLWSLLTSEEFTTIH